MLTQADLLARLNQLTIRYNLSWMDIKYDADAAIAKINSYLGTNYPKMSDKLTSPTSTYTINMDGVDVEIFPEEHMHGVVVPFIAMEVLARDEEFTTIYNKLSADLENGLFTMFQKEFNRVPLTFRQNPDQGVFFAADSALAAVRHNLDADLPVFKFHVHYHINNSKIALSGDFVGDTRAYLYGDTATVKGWNNDLLSIDGTEAFHFLGWTRNEQIVSDTVAVGSTINMMSDIHLYAKWSTVSTLTCTVLGTVSIKDAYKPSLTRLVIPDIVDGAMVRTIPSNFLLHTTDVTKHAVNVQSITLPRYLTTVEQSAFNGFQGTEILFAETVVNNTTYQGIVINNAAFTATPNLLSILLPANIVTMNGTPFPAVAGKTLTIRCRILEQNKPARYQDGNSVWHGWDAAWYAYSNPNLTPPYVVNVVWGYNV